MSKQNTIDEIRKKWPRNCPWPAPIGNFGGMNWDEYTLPDALNDYAQDLVDIKDYFDKQVDEGRLNSNYYINEDYEDPLSSEDNDEEMAIWQPEEGMEFWDEDHFDIDAWEDELSSALNMLKIDLCENDPATLIHQILGYCFINENLLRQAFTRRAFQIEYGLSGCSEELEFFGDSVLSFITSREMARNLGAINDENTESPFHSKLDEGAMSRLKSSFVCKEYLAKRCAELGLDQFILYGSGEKATESAKEDAIEALIGAVAMDCNWDMHILEEVVDRLICMQINTPEQYLKKSYYELINSWHMRVFGKMPEYLITRKVKNGLLDDSCVDCTIKFYVPSNNKGIYGNPITRSGEGRSKARESAAEFAYHYLVANGLWMNLANANIVPEPYSAINQLQELFQKKYIEKPEYDFSESDQLWNCNCVVNGVVALGYGSSKIAAKKMAAYKTLIRLLRAAGCCKDEWYNNMIEITSNGMLEETSEMMSEKNDPIKIAAQYRGGIKYTAVAKILEQVESGSVITEKVLVEWVKQITGMNTLGINWKEFPYPNLREESIPFHRFLTSKGLVEEYYKDQLVKEGHEVVPTKTTNWRVVDYKETMVDVEKLILPVDAIGYEGSFLENVRKDVKEALMEKISQQKK